MRRFRSADGVTVAVDEATHTIELTGPDDSGPRTFVANTMGRTYPLQPHGWIEVCGSLANIMFHLDLGGGGSPHWLELRRDNGKFASSGFVEVAAGSEELACAAGSA
jgi:hypothetical protein